MPHEDYILLVGGVRGGSLWTSFLVSRLTHSLSDGSRMRIICEKLYVFNPIEKVLVLLTNGCRPTSVMKKKKQLLLLSIYFFFPLTDFLLSRFSMIVTIINVLTLRIT